MATVRRGPAIRLGVIIAAVLVTGIITAAVRGTNDNEAARTVPEAQVPTAGVTTTTPPDAVPSTAPAAIPTVAPPVTTPATASSAGGAPTSPTTAAAAPAQPTTTSPSGLVQGGVGRAGTRAGTRAVTGGPNLLPIGALLFGVALLMRRYTRPRSVTIRRP
jgi:hypothetical protein